MVASQCTYGQNLDSSKNASFFMDNHVLRYQIAAHPRSKASELAEVFVGCDIKLYSPLPMAQNRSMSTLSNKSLFHPLVVRGSTPVFFKFASNKSTLQCLPPYFCWLNSFSDDGSLLGDAA